MAEITNESSSRRKQAVRCAGVVLALTVVLIYGGTGQAAEKEYWRNVVTATGKSKARAVNELIVKTEAVEKVMFERCEKAGGMLVWSDVVTTGGKDNGRAEQTLICLERPRRTAWEAPDNQVR